MFDARGGDYYRTKAKAKAKAKRSGPLLLKMRNRWADEMHKFV